MKDEFKRFGLEKFGTITAILELLGAVGLLVGLRYNVVLLVSSGGLSLLMLLGIIVRIKVNDRFWVLLPALIFMLLNLLIFYITLNFGTVILKLDDSGSLLNGQSVTYGPVSGKLVISTYAFKKIRN